MTETNKLFSLNLKHEWPILVLLVACIAYGAYVYPALPEQVPSHWNVNGEVDGWSSREWGAFALPLLNLGLYGAFFVFPRIDPNKNKYGLFTSAYNAFRYVFHVIMAGLFVITILSAQGMDIDINRIVPMGISVLIMVIGNYMGKVQKNYFFGIKNPWTLASEEVWRKTHRLAGPIWVSAGLVSFLAALINGKVAFMAFMGSMAVATLVPFVYSYLQYKKLNNS